MAWRWDHGDSIILSERNAARDRNLFRPLKKESRDGIAEKAEISPMRTGGKKVAAKWKWEGDDRVFLIPVEVLAIMSPSTMSLMRDIIMYVGHLYRVQGFPENLQVSVTLRELARQLGLSWKGSLGHTLDNCLTFSRMYTIQGYDVFIVKNNKRERTEKATFGFIDYVGRVTTDSERKIPHNQQWYNVHLSKLYAGMLRTLPPAPLPVAALEMAHLAPKRLVVPVKNLAYYLAARIPGKNVKLKQDTLMDIIQLQRDLGCSRPDKTRKSAEQVIEALYPIMIQNHTYDSSSNMYIITLAGRIVKS